MRRLRTAALLCSLAAAAFAGEEDGALTARYFLEMSEQPRAALAALAYIRGVLDTNNAVMVSLAVEATIEKRARRVDIPLICMPAGAKTDQALAVVQQYVRTHPERWHEPIGYVARDALLQAWRCST